jgi:hypothetical protein
MERRMLNEKQHDPTESLSNDVIWEVTTIAKEIGRTPRQTFHLLETGQLPAKKIGGRWCSTRSALRQHFAMPVAGEVA